MTDVSPKQFMEAIEQLAYEKKLPIEKILQTVEAAYAAAYRKDFGHPEQHVRAKLDPKTGKSTVFVVWTVAKEVENPNTEITVAEGKKRGMKNPKEGDELVEKVNPPAEYGRIAAQTAKQVIIQRIREVEREIVQEEFSGRTGELMTGSVQRIEGRNVFVEIGRAQGILMPEDQIERERYYIGQRLRVLLKAVDPEGRGAQLILTRSHPDFVRRLFELEVPEIHAGTVEIKSVAREAGVRTKVAVHSNQEGVDPVGTCVGQRGTRVQAIMAELGDEKIDIVLYAEDTRTYISNALSPAKISKIDLDEEHKTASINVADDQLSLAIGRGGQNVRLAGELTGWQLDIEKSDKQKQAETETVVTSIPIAKVDGVSKEQAEAFTKAGLKTAQQVAAASDEDLAKVELADEEKKELIAKAADAVSAADEAPAEEAEEKAPAEPKKEKTEPEPKSDEKQKAAKAKPGTEKKPDDKPKSEADEKAKSGTGKKPDAEAAKKSEPQPEAEAATKAAEEKSEPQD